MGNTRISLIDTWWFVTICLLLIAMMLIETFVRFEHREMRRRIEVLEARPYIEKVQVPDGTRILFNDKSVKADEGAME